MMIEVTERAKHELKKLLATSADWPGAVLRLMDRGGGQLGLGIDIEAEDDQVLEYEGQKLLLVKPGLPTKFKRVKLDVDETPVGAEFVILKES